MKLVSIRDLLLAGATQSNDLKDALESEMAKTKEMEESMRHLASLKLPTQERSDLESFLPGRCDEHL